MFINTKTTKILLAPLFWGVLSSTLLAEDIHTHHGWEMGLSLGYANLQTEKEEGVNLHLHLMKSLGDEDIRKYFSFGLGFETIKTDESHYGAMLTLDFHPIEDFTFGISPGFEWAKHDGTSWEREYATHLEATYSFDVLKGYHIGPSIGYSKTKDAEHYTMGIHVGMVL